MKKYRKILARVSEATIENRIYIIRGEKVMVDRDLANLYGVPTKILNQAVKRNLERFPKDFMFQLNEEETQNWRSQFVTSNWAKMGIRRNPFVFTQNGVLCFQAFSTAKEPFKLIFKLCARSQNSNKSWQATKI